MKTINKLLLSSALAVSSFSAFNQEKADATIYVNAGVGTQGISVGASWYWKNFLGVRGEYSFMPSQVLSLATNVIKNSSDFITDAKAQFHSGAIDLSIRPFKGAFRIDAGMRIMDYSMKINGFSAVDVPYADNAGAVAEAVFEMSKGVKPYLGIGWDFNPFLGLTLGFDIGIIWTGQWKISKLDADITYGNMDQARYEAFRNDYGNDIDEALEDVRSIKKDANDAIPSFLQFWPVIKFNIGYKFNVLF